MKVIYDSKDSSPIQDMTPGKIYDVLKVELDEQPEYKIHEVYTLINDKGKQIKHLSYFFNQLGEMRNNKIKQLI